MNDKVLKELLKNALENNDPPAGLRERLLINILNDDGAMLLTPLERLVFHKPLRTAFVFSAALSFGLYAVFGNAYLSILSGL